MTALRLEPYDPPPACDRRRAERGRVRCERPIGHADDFHAGRGRRGQWLLWSADAKARTGHGQCGVSPVDAVALAGLAAIVVAWVAALAWAAITAPVPVVLLAVAAYLAVVVTGMAREGARDWLSARARRASRGPATVPSTTGSPR